MELEGLRGLAAIAVVLCHYINAFYPALITGDMNLQHMGLEDSIYGTPLGVLFSGTFAVAIFFVLSGFVLSIGFFRSKRVDVVKKLASNRYLRLMLPALASVIIALVLIKAGVSNVDQAASVTLSSWLGGAWQFETGVWDALRNGAFDIFVAGHGSAYNNVLWTMHIEFVGSFIVFGFLLLAGESSRRWAAYALTGMLTFNTWFLPFIIGMMLADLHSSGKIRQIRRTLVSIPLLAAGIFLGGYPLGKVEGTWYEFTQPIANPGFNYKMLYLTLAASLLVLVAISSKPIARFLQKKIVSVLGRYAFSMYLVHLFVLYTITTGMFVMLHDQIGYTKTFLLTTFISAPAIALTSWAFERYIDAPSIRFAKYCTSLYNGNGTIDLKQRWLALRMSFQFRLTILKDRLSAFARPTEDSLD